MTTLIITGAKKAEKDLLRIAQNIPKSARQIRVKASRRTKTELANQVKMGAWKPSKTQLASARLSKSFKVRSEKDGTYVYSDHPAVVVVNEGGTWQINEFWVHDSNAKQVYFGGAPLIYSNYAHSVRGKHFVEKTGKNVRSYITRLIKEEGDIRRLVK